MKSLKKILSLTLIFALLLTSVPVGSFATTSIETDPSVSVISEDETGSGYWSDGGNYDTSWYDNNPTASEYALNTASELAGLAVLVDNGVDFYNVIIKLANNIDLSGIGWNPIGSYVSDSENKPFRGTFDGQNYEITGLTASGNYSALFAYISGDVTIENLIMKNVEVTGKQYVAAVVAYANAETGIVKIENCYLDGTVKEPDDDYQNGYSAAVIGYLNAQNGTAVIRNCELHCGVSSTRNAGGVVGYATGNTSNVIQIENCHNYTSITGGNNSEYCGGIAGYATNVKFSKCSNYGSVYGNSTSDDNGSLWHGGIAGRGSYMTFEDCANYGEIKAWEVGGLTASTSVGLVAKNCLNAGKLTHKSTPDGDGYALFYNGSYENCYYVSGRMPQDSSAVEYVTAEQLASGEICYRLNGSRTEEASAWGQNLDNGDTIQTYPVLGSAPVYAIESGYTNNSAYIAKGTCGENASWILDKDGVLIISGTGIMQTFDSSFKSDLVKKAIIEDGIKSIYLEGCSNLTEVVIPSSVMTIDEKAFYDCSSLTTITIPDSVTAIGPFAFYNCSGLTSITIPENVAYVGEYAFSGCSSLTSIIIPDQVVSIEMGTFEGCHSITSITIPESVISIANDAFLGCDNVVFRGVEKSYAYEYAVEMGIDFECIHKNIEIIPEVKPTCKAEGSTEAQMCNDCGFELKKAEVIPPLEHSCEQWTVTKVATATETGIETGKCTSCGETLTREIPCDENILGVGTCGKNAAWVLDSEGVLTISGTGAMGKFDSSFRSYKVKKVIIEDGITSIVSEAFKGGYNITEATIPNSVTSIGFDAFSGCSSLTTITIPDSVTSIEDYTFGGCSSLTSVTIPNSVTSIGNSAFRNCSSLTSITIPDNVTSIEDYTFYGCSSLTSITIPDNVTSIGSSAFDNCRKLTTVTIPDSVTSIGAGAFSSCLRLTTIIIPDSVTSIGRSAFSGCNSLTTITIPEGVISIGDSVFYYCKNLTNVTIPNSVTSIGSSAFDGCINLTTITIPKGVISIGDFAFYNCQKLTTITIPESVTDIGYSAIEGNSSLVIFGIANSYAHEYATENNMNFQCISHQNIVTFPAVDPSCSETGLTVGKKCMDCGTTFVTQEIVPKLDHSYSTSVTAPSCIQKGYTTYTCTVCGDSYVDSYTDAKEHTYTSEVTTEATCQKEGVKTYTCECGHTYTESIDRTAHTEEILPSKDATCTETGLSEGKKCSECGEILEAQKVTSKLDHDYETKVTAPTCTKEGYTTHTCACGASYVDNYTDAKKHTYTSEVTTEATCQKKGVETFTCECGHTYTESIDRKDHTEEILPGKEETCTETGLSEGKKCSVCGEILVAQKVTPKMDHDYTSKVTSEPTCIANGVKTYSCACGDTYTEKIDKLSHSYETSVIEPTCTKKGYTTHTCTVCGASYVDSYTDTKEHTYTSEVTTEATCQKKGVETFTCECGHTYTESIDRIAHTEEILPGKDSTCIETGLSEGKKCSVCGETLEAQKVTPKLNHSYTSTVTSTATCTANGATTYTCACGDTYTEKIDKLSHSYKTSVTEPTCAKKGYSIHTCTICGDSYIDSYTKLTAHQYTSKVTSAASCTKEGIKTFTCKCGHEYIEAIDKAAHTEKTLVGKAATCTETGLTEGKECTTCGTIIVEQKTIKVKAHNYNQNYTVDIAASASADGLKSQHCVDCDATTNKTVIYKLNTVKLKADTYSHNGKTKSPELIVKDSNGNSLSAENYVISTPSGRKNVGTYKYKVTFKNEYVGTETLTLTIKPKATSVTKLSASKKAFTVKLGKVSTQATGYEVMYATNKSFTKGKKTVKITSYKTTSKKISKLTSKKTYYVKVRTYKTVNGVKIYSDWSKVKTVKVK